MSHAGGRISSLISSLAGNRRPLALGHPRVLLNRVGLLCLGLLVGRLWAGTFSAGLDREVVEAGGSAILVLDFVNFGNVEAPPPPAVPGADVQYAGASTQSQILIVNGQTTRQTTIRHQYAITPKSVGTLTIPPISLNVGGQLVTSPAMQLTVAKGQELSDFAQLKLLTPTNTLYVGQPFAARIQFWFRQSPTQVGAPQLSTDGFVGGRPVKPLNIKAPASAGDWAAAEYPVLFTPARAGTLPIGPAELETIFPVGGRRGDFLSDFFGNREQRRFKLQSASNTIVVVEPPLAGRPAGFQGAIGRYIMRMGATPTNVAVGDPITVKIGVQGTGGLDGLTLPELPANSGFRVYPGTNGVQWRDAMTFVGSKVFEVVVVPERADLKEISFPPLVSFDPEKQEYVVTQGNSIALTVRPGATNQATPSVVPEYAAAGVATNEAPALARLQPLPAGVDRPAKTAARAWTQRPWYWTTLLLPLVGVAGWAGSSTWLRRRADDPAARQRAAAAERLRAANARLQHARGREFLEALDHVIAERISRVTGDPATAGHRGDWEAALSARGLADEDAERLRRLWSALETRRFAPGPAATADADEAALRAEGDAVLASLAQLEGRA